TLGNSTIAQNNATVEGGGIYNARSSSCIIYDNLAPTGSNYSSIGYTPNYSCVNPLPPGETGDITNAPAFIDAGNGNFRLQTNSPCINIGSGSPGMYDLDGRPRIVGGKIDMGAYEFQGPGVGEFTAWLQQHGLPTDGSADYADSDGDGMNN